MKNHQLRVLTQVADSGSIRAAARALHLSQSALTRSLRELEEECDTQLLIRSHKGVEFTEAGKALLSRARLVLATLDKALQEVRQLRGGAGTTVSVGVTPVAAHRVLPAVLTDFRKVQPDAEVRFTEGLLSNVLPGLIEGQLDFAIAFAEPDTLPAEIVARPLDQVAAVPACRSGHPLAQATEWSQLSTADWVLTSLGSHLLGWMRTEGLPEPRQVVSCSSPLLVLDLMRGTDLLGFVPEPLLAGGESYAGLHPLAVEPLPPPVTLCLLSLRHASLGLAARHMAELFQRRLRHRNI